MATSGRAGKRQLTWILTLQERDGSLKSSGGFFRAKPLRQRTCPSCQAAFSVSDAARSYVCLCGRVLRVDSASSAPLVEVTCPVCASRWGAHADAGAMTCHGCGTSLVVANGAASPGARDAACSHCGAAVGSGAYFCPACGGLLTRPYLDAVPVSPSSPLSKPEAAELLDYTDEALAGERPAGFTQASMTANSPVGYFVRASWVAEVTRREVLEARSTGTAIDYFTFMMLLGRLDHAVACLALTIDADERFAGSVGARLTDLESLVSSLIGVAVDRTTGALTGSGDSRDYYGPQQSRFEKVLAALAGDRNTVRRESALPGEAIVAWPEPLFELKVGGTSFVRKPNGMSVPYVSLAVDNWAAWLSRSEKFLPADGDAVLESEITVPAAVLAFMATPPAVRVVAAAPSLVFSED